MIFRYDFGEKLDLSRFKKQAAHYIGIVSKTEYHLYTKDFKIVFNTEPNINLILVTVSVYSLERDSSNDIICSSVIYFHSDSRFESSLEIHKLFGEYSMNSAQFSSKSSTEVVDKMCMLIKIMHKINHLKAFL